MNVTDAAKNLLKTHHNLTERHRSATVDRERAERAISQLETELAQYKPEALAEARTMVANAWARGELGDK